MPKLLKMLEQQDKPHSIRETELMMMRVMIQREEERIIVCINFSNTRYQKLTLNNAHASYL